MYVCLASSLCPLLTLAQVAAVPPSDESEEFEGFDDVPEKESHAVDEATESTESKTTDGLEASSTESVAAEPTKEDEKDSKPQKPQQDQKKEKKDRKDKKTAKAQQPEADPELETNVFAQAAAIADVEAAEDDVDLSEWVSLGLSSLVLSCIARLKFLKPTPIQARAIPEVINGHDVIGKAATGSGKTLAFGVPIVEAWLSRIASAESSGQKHPIALILSPTRELAHQITDHLKQLCAGLASAPYVCSVTGGLAVQKQERQLQKADIVVGTPGRLWEVMSTSNAVMQSFRSVSFLVVDEADRILKDGHFKEAEKILLALDRTAPGEEDDDSDEEEKTSRRRRQTLVFSATFNKALQQKLAGKARYNLMGETESLEYLLKRLNFRERPKFIDTNPVTQMAENLKEGLIQCGDMEKDLYLYAVLLLQPTRRALVFTNSINTVRRLTAFLNNLNLPVFALHSEMEQKARLRSIERFKADNHPNKSKSNNAASILVATDVAARGLDIPLIDLVVHYHVPRSADDYVHRSGRTARATNSGVSILLCGPKEAIPTQRLINKVHAAAVAKNPNPVKSTKGLGVQTIDIDRRLVQCLRPRVTLSQKITEATMAKERGAKEDEWLRKAAEELGVDPEEAEELGMWKGKGSGKKQREREARMTTKAEMKQMRWELKELLSKRVNNGVSEKYLRGVDVESLLQGARGEFLGVVEGLGI